MKSNFAKLIAREGYVYTNGEVYGHEIDLSEIDSPDNWHEVPESEIPTEPNEEEEA